MSTSEPNPKRLPNQKWLFCRYFHFLQSPDTQASADLKKVKISLSLLKSHESRSKIDSFCEIGTFRSNLTNQFSFLATMTIMIFIACTGKKQLVKESHQNPNIILLLADDLGYGDLGCYGGVAHTPHLDQMAREGIQFTDFYAAAPNCSPSRAGLLTGRMPAKVGMYNYLSDNHPMHLKNEEITLAEVLKEKNYNTGHFGKWHVSNIDPSSDHLQPQPSDQGFDYSFGTSNNAHPSHRNPDNFVRNGKKVGKIRGFSCDIVVKEAISWLNNINLEKSPFLLYLAFHEPHKKVASPKKLIRNYDQFSFEDAEYFANVENMDQAIGQLVTELKRKNLYENSIIIFASDNGSYRNGSNGPLLGGKSFVYEGGIRVPGIIKWKNRIKPGQTCSDPVGLIDLMPTLCKIVNGSHPRPDVLDGSDISSLLFAGQEIKRKSPLSWFFYRTSPEIAMRLDRYSILARDTDTTSRTHAMSQPDMEYIKNMTVEKFEVYDLDSDLGQLKMMNLNQLKNGEEMQKSLLERLEEIQAVGPYWNNLPPATGKKKQKHEWRQLHPKGFSN